VPRHSIAVVARRTGLTQLVLRAWERRYGVVLPGRTDAGRRRYSDLDIERLTLLRVLTSADHRIGDVANLPQVELRKLVADLGPGAMPAPVRPARVDGPAPASGVVTADMLLGQALVAVAALDAGALENVLSQATLHLSRPALRQDLILPLLFRVGELWRDGTLRIAHEHMASNIVHSFLAAANAGQVPDSGAPLLIVATPLRNRHELGALMAASLGLESGWAVLYLGADLPAEEIAAAVAQRQARAVFVSLIYPTGDAVVAAQLEVLRRLLGSEVGILVGGAAAPSYGETLVAICGRLVTTPPDFAEALQEILN
jgi:DNA-binding transcriptional MerR regulator/methylmalonyl-CoA mutase cobalamin-binding subunit